MSHFAKVKNGIVVDVIVADQEFVDNLDGVWIQTSYNTSFNVHSNGETPLRKNFAGKGHIYDSELDAFYSPSPYPSWILNETIGKWEPPVKEPDDPVNPKVGFYEWDEDATDWVVIRYGDLN